MDTRNLPDYAEFDDYVYTQRIAVLVRWFLIVTWLVLQNTRPNLDEGFFFINNALALTLAALNGYVHWRILKGRPITSGYVLALSLMDLSVITVGIGVSSRFGNHFVVLYYPALLALSLVFSSRRLSSRRVSRRPSSSSTRRMRSLRSRSPISTRSPTSATRSAWTFMTLPAGWGWTVVSVGCSSIPVPDSARMYFEKFDPKAACEAWKLIEKLRRRWLEEMARFDGRSESP